MWNIQLPVWKSFFGPCRRCIFRSTSIEVSSHVQLSTDFLTSPNVLHNTGESLLVSLSASKIENTRTSVWVLWQNFFLSTKTINFSMEVFNLLIKVTHFIYLGNKTLKTNKIYEVNRHIRQLTIHPKEVDLFCNEAKRLDNGKRWLWKLNIIRLS